MSQQKNKKDNRDSDYGSNTDTQTAGAGKTENAFDSKESKDESGTTTTSGTSFGKKDETSATDASKATTPGSDKKNLGELEQQISKSATKSDFGSDQKKDKNYDEENRRLTGEADDSEEHDSEKTKGKGLSNQQTDFRRGNHQGPDSRNDNSIWK
jgi:hypothetical protein